jgi:methionine synthase II (cobalamin-independent)
LPSKEEAIRELRRAQWQYEGAEKRTQEFREMFRDERDAAIKMAVDARVPKKEIAEIVHSTPQWVNKILRGEAYGRLLD